MPLTNKHIDCKGCNQPFRVTPSMLRQGRKCCSVACKQKYVWSQESYRLKMSEAHKGKIPINIKWLVENSRTEAHKERVRQSIPKRSGKNHPRWIEDRNLIKKSERHTGEGSSIALLRWTKGIKDRDNWNCQISNEDCKGKMESHHILNWIDYPELRYELSNGITLCHSHHPRGRKKEAQLSSFLQELVSTKSI